MSLRNKIGRRHIAFYAAEVVWLLACAAGIVLFWRIGTGPMDRLALIAWVVVLTVQSLLLLRAEWCLCRAEKNDLHMNAGDQPSEV